jgi:uncharacterized protein YfaS (alpha-2-macroglobulin family)
MFRFRTLVVLLVSLAVGCTCGEKTTTEKVTAAGKAPPLDLKPLPQAPTVSVQQEPGFGEDLEVAAARPQGLIEAEVRPTVTFSKPVKSLEQVEEQRAKDKAQPFARIEPKLEGEWRWLGSASAEFVPSKLVPLSTHYTVTVMKGLAALDGTALKEDYSFTFDTPPLKLEDVAPFRGFRWLKADDEIRLLFNQPVANSELESKAWFKVQDEPQPFKLKVIKRVSIQDEKREEVEAARKAGKRPPADYEPLSDDERGYRNQQMRYVVKPEKPFPLGKDVTLELSPDGLHGEQGPAPMTLTETPAWRTYGPLELADAQFCGDGHCSYGPLEVRTSNEVELETVKSKLKIEPSVEIDWDAAHTWAPANQYENSPWAKLVLPGKFKPGIEYKISIAAGVTDVFKQTSAKPFASSAATAELEPSLVTGPYMGLIEAGAESPKLPVEVANLSVLDVRMWNITQPAELVQAFLEHDRAQWLKRNDDFHETQNLKYRRNEGHVHPVELSKIFKDKKTGVALVTVNSKDLKYPLENGAPSLVQVTDLAAHVKVGPKKSAVWVTRLSSGAPVAGADVTLYDETGAQKWKGTTGADGVADVPGTVELKVNTMEYAWEYPKLVVLAQKDGDLAGTADTWASGVEPYEFGLSEGWEGDAPQAHGFVFTDRGIYRPGDTVYVKGVARFRRVGDLKSPSAGSVMTVTVTDSKNEKVKTADVKVSKYGTFALDAVVGKDAPTGYYGITANGEAESGGFELHGSFRVEEYRAPQFRVDVETPKKSLVQGEALEAKVLARYLFGGAMADAKVKWSVNRSSTSFSSDAAPDFSFSQETWWWDDREPEASNGFFASGNGTCDAKGELPLAPGKVEAPGEKPWKYTVEGEVEDVNRQAVAGRVELTVHPSQFYVGLRAPTGFMQTGNEYGFETVVTDTDGKRVGGRKVDVSIVERVWKSVKKKDATGGFSTVSEPEEKEVSKCAVTSAADQAVPCKFKPADSGFYIVKASVQDDGGRKHSSSMGAYATGPGFVSWQRNDTDRIELVADKAKYDVGETAKVLIKSPYPEANALLTVEREGVLSRRVLALKGSVTTVDVPITEDAVPNIYVGVVLMRPRVAQGGIETGDDPGRPNARIGLVKLDVEKKTKRLAVKVTTDKPQYQPGQEVTVSLDIGKADAEVTLYAVDEAVLRLTSYQTPDPINAIFTERPLSVRLGEPLLHLVRRRSYGEKGEPAGGGGGNGEGAGFRSNFKTTAIWLPSLEVHGTGTAKFRLPDNLTTFRIMAVAVTDGDRFGSGDVSIQVNKPVLVLPALPRFARVGDKFEAGVVVHTYGTSAGEVTVTASVQGATLTGAAEKKVQVSETAPKEVRFAFTAEAPGTAVFRFKAVKGSDQDGVEEKIPVELPVAMEAVATYGDTDGKAVEGVVPPKEVWPDLGGLQVTMASTSLGNFSQGFQQLIEYPYGCLEQQSSRLIPFIALREIAGQFKVPWPGPDKKKLAKESEFNALLNTYLFPTLDVSKERDPDAVIATTVKSIMSLQSGDGSFKYWPDAWCGTSWTSAYAALTLQRAKDVGFDVPEERLARASGFLSKVAGGTCLPCEHSCDDETRVLAAYTLARMKQPKASVYGELYSRRDKLPLFSQALLANAMFVGGGDRKKAQALLQEILNYAKESPKGLHIEEANTKTYATYFGSDTRTNGAVLQALTDINPSHPFVGKMARYLTSVRQGDGEWRNTQEAAWSLMALTEVVRTKEKDTPDYKATVAMGAASLFEQTFKGRSMKIQEQKLPMAELLKKTGGTEQKLTFSKDGTGVLYYSALLKYAPKQLPMTSLDNGLFVQRWFEPYTGGGQSTKFYAGDLVRVRVRVATNQERHWAAFEVPLPAGLEPVDTSLSTTAKNVSSPNEEKRDVGYEGEGEEEGEGGSAYEGEEMGPWAFAFWSPFNHVEQRDSRVVLFADHLPPGVHVSSFVARATTPGTYLMKPARGELMYEPEVWGRSEGGTFEVVLPTPVSEK